MSSSPIANKKSRQYSIRLPWAVSNAVDAFASQHRIAANRAIIELLERGLNAPSTTDKLQQPSTLERLEALEALVHVQREALEALKAQGVSKTSARGQQDIPGDPGAYLGRLCPKRTRLEQHREVSALQAQ